MSNMPSIMPLSHHRCFRITYRYPIRTLFSCVINRGFEGEAFPVAKEGVVISLITSIHCSTRIFSIISKSLCPITLHLNYMKSLPTVWTFFHVATEETEGVWWEGV